MNRISDNCNIFLQKLFLKHCEFKKYMEMKEGVIKYSGMSKRVTSVYFNIPNSKDNNILRISFGDDWNCEVITVGHNIKDHEHFSLEGNVELEIEKAINYIEEIYGNKSQ